VKLLRLELRRFRNFERAQVEPSKHATIAVGPNGQGKTNLLEAIYFLCTLKPLRANRLLELIHFGDERAEVEGRFLLGGAERQIAVEIGQGTRQALVDGKRTAQLEEYFGGVSVVAFTPDDLEVVKGSPEARRRFLDRAVFNRFPAFLKESREYGRALKSRNRLLKQGAEPAYLQAYDETIARLGARIWVRRRALLSELGGSTARVFSEVGRLSVPARFEYRPAHLPAEEGFDTDEPSLQARLAEALVLRLRRDRERGYTSAGPHADDLSIELGDHPARSFASQGQQRALVLSWKIAEIENLEARMGAPPLLLLDDVSSELDPERNGYLMSYLARSGVQVFLTTTDARLVQGAVRNDSLWLQVQSGSVAPTAAPLA
jgi:DNA replication and repair protein RecF